MIPLNALEAAELLRHRTREIAQSERQITYFETLASNERQRLDRLIREAEHLGVLIDHGVPGASVQPPASSGKALTGKAQGAWLPIETAPKDGSEILLTDGSTVCAGFWDDAAGCRRADAGWFEECDRAALINAKNLAATHWQSMPAPPAPSGQGGR